MKADVSVIIPVYNSAAEARRAVASVARQTLLPKEVIIVDDCSTDVNNRFILEAIQQEYTEYLNIELIFQDTNKGAGETRNTGWEVANCEYIAFLDSDDIWHPQKLELQYNYMIKHKNIYFSCHHMDTITEENIFKFDEKLVSYSKNEIIKINFERYLFKHYPRGGTSFVMLRNINGYRFKAGKRYSEDYLLWLEYCHDYSGVLINEVLAASFKEIYGAGGLSGNLLKIEQGELDTFNILKKKGYINSFIWILCFLFSIVKFLRRYLIVCYRNIVAKKGSLSCSTPPRD